MAFVPAPGVLQTVATGVIGAQPWACVLHWQQGSSTSPWTLAPAQALANAFMSRYSTDMGSYTGSNVSLKAVNFVDLSNATPISGTTTAAAVLGGHTQALEPSSLTLNIQLKISSRYRGGKGRVNWPAVTPDSLTNESNLLPNYATNVQGAFATYMSHIAADANTGGAVGTIQVVPRWTYTYTDVPGKHKYTKVRSGYVGAFPVNAWQVNPIVGQQRRRLRN